MRKKNTARLYTLAATFFGELGNACSLYCYDVSDALKRCSAMNKLSSFGFCKLLLENCFYGCDIREKWRETVKSSDELALMSEDARKTFSDFSDSIGKTAADVFLIRCREYEKYFSELAENENNELAKNGRLAVGSGVMAAALFLICVL